MAVQKKATPEGQRKRIIPDSTASGVPIDDGSDEATPEGQLAVDVFQTSEDIVVVAPLAGVRMKDVAVSVNANVLTIRGNRSFRYRVPRDNYFTQECFWGSFSRSIILPDSVDATQIRAHSRDGILTVQIPKIEKMRMRTITIQTEEE